jgi:VanZ family protein
MHPWRVLFPVLWMALIWYLSSLTSSEEGHLAGYPIHPIIQNGAHAVFYGVLAALWAFALGPDEKTAQRAVLYSALYGLIDEVHQYFVPGRTCSILDLTVDLLGATIVAYLLTRVAGYAPPVSKQAT